MTAAPTLAVLLSPNPTRDELRGRIAAVDHQADLHAEQLGRLDAERDRLSCQVAETYAQIRRHHGEPNTWPPARCAWLDLLSERAELARLAVVAGEAETSRLQRDRTAVVKHLRELDVANMPALCDYDASCLNDAAPGGTHCEEHSQLALEGVS